VRGRAGGADRGAARADGACSPTLPPSHATTQLIKLIKLIKSTLKAAQQSVALIQLQLNFDFNFNVADLGPA
jgi:hypothetical protein